MFSAAFAGPLQRENRRAAEFGGFPFSYRRGFDMLSTERDGNVRGRDAMEVTRPPGRTLLSPRATPQDRPKTSVLACPRINP